ncbi:MAG TPA: nuclear transport factor 2 family protein [Microthrixaceae bacterium]|nr:nuclear transport factor 2 family protein [Microthrixaceae bacterium]
MTSVEPANVAPATVDALRRHWDDGWNRGDVDTIMEPFANDVVFSSPYIPVVGGDPDRTTIVGRDALRTYVAGALVRSPGIRYTVDATYVGTDSVVLVYRCHYPDGRPDLAGVDSMRVDAQGLIVEWRCHYA